ncbi:MAG: hypothetical protein ACJAZ9_000682, partial [Neolewinella sp.]
AKIQARELMSTMFDPVVRGVGRDYKIEVRFERMPDRGTQGQLG